MGMSQSEDGVEVVVSDAQGGEQKMVMLRSEDGEEFVVSGAEASQCGRTIDFMIKYDYKNNIIPSVGGKTNCSPIRLFVQGDTLSKVIQYSKMHASGSQYFQAWDAEFIGGFDHKTLFDLILAANYLRNQALLNLTCQTVANMIKGKSFDEIRGIFNIRSYVTNLNKNMSGVKKVNTLDRWLTTPLSTPTPAQDSNMILEHTSGSRRGEMGDVEECGPMEISGASSACDEDLVLTLQQNAVKALHIVRCQEFTGYDPKRNDFICTRFSSYNIAFFDLDKESRLAHGPPLDRMIKPISRSGVQSSVNVISLKVTESLVGDDISVFGTVLARDQVDYRCMYLFRREMDDTQAITLPDGILTLTDPCRSLVLLDQIYFEINLKIKCDGGEIKDLSRGVLSFDRARLPADRQTMTLGLNSWLSRVELACEHIVQPVEATIAINILKGPCNISRVAWIHGNTIILYDSEAVGTQIVTGDGGSSVPLTRRVVAVPVDEKLVLQLVGDENIEHVRVTLGQSDKLSVCEMGLGEVQVKVAWTGIRKRRDYELETIGNQCLLH